MNAPARGVQSKVRWASILASLLILLLPAGQLTAQVPTPESVIGWEPGADYELADYSQIEAYFQALDEASDRIQLRAIGESVQGRTLHLALISSEENLENLDRRGGADRIQFQRYEPDPSIEGRTLDEMAESRDMDPLEAAMDLIREGNADIVSFNMDPDDVERIMKQPWVMTCTDGGLVSMDEGVPHPRTYGAYPRKLRKYVREDDVIDLGHAVRSMTGLSGAVFRMTDRGLLRPGAAADLVVFDLEKVEDVATFSDPHHYSRGMEFVIVMGSLAVDQGEFTGAVSGRVLSLRTPGASTND